MAYTPTQFQQGQTITATSGPQEFNKIEQGIVDMEAQLDTAVADVTRYVESEQERLLLLDGTRPMNGDIRITGNNGIALGNSNIGQTAANPNALTLTPAAGGDVLVNGSPVWTATRRGFAVYNAYGGLYVTPNAQNLVPFSVVAGYDISESPRTSANSLNSGRVVLADAGKYMVIFSASSIMPTYPTVNYAQYKIQCGDQQSGLFYVPRGTNRRELNMSMTWIPPSVVAAGTMVSVHVSAREDTFVNPQLSIIRIP